MNELVADKILRCDSLPSLPAIAAKVIELTSDPDVSMDELAKLIEQDQALAAKVLRTVNSSFYALRQKCTTIQKAIVMLGLGPVKSLTLGFSLVSALEIGEDGGFDYQAYWRRSLIGAMGAKAIADKARLDDADEAFLAALLRDVGMIVLHRALGDEYLAVITETGSHDRLVAGELASIDAQHPEVGAMLAEQWKLPESLTLPVRYHERPTAAPMACVATVQCVAMGGYLEGAISAQDPVTSLRRLYQKGKAWFDLTPAELDETISQVSASAKEMATLFNLDVGEIAPAEDLLVTAETHLIEMAKKGERESYAERRLQELLVPAPPLDGLTGAYSKAGFLMAIKELAPALETEGAEISLAQVLVHGIDAPGEGNPEDLADEAQIAVVSALYRSFEQFGAIVSRLNNSVYAVLLPAVALRSAVPAVEFAIQNIDTTLAHLRARAGISNEAWPIRISAGVTGAETESGSRIDTAALLSEATSCLKTAHAQSETGGTVISRLIPAKAA